MAGQIRLCTDGDCNRTGSSLRRNVPTPCATHSQHLPCGLGLWSARRPSSCVPAVSAPTATTQATVMLQCAVRLCCGVLRCSVRLCGGVLCGALCCGVMCGGVAVCLVTFFSSGSSTAANRCSSFNACCSACTNQPDDPHSLRLTVSLPHCLSNSLSF